MDGDALLFIKGLPLLQVPLDKELHALQTGCGSRDGDVVLQNRRMPSLEDRHERAVHELFVTVVKGNVERNPAALDDHCLNRENVVEPDHALPGKVNLFASIFQIFDVIALFAAESDAGKALKIFRTLGNAVASQILRQSSISYVWINENSS